MAGVDVRTRSNASAKAYLTRHKKKGGSQAKKDRRAADHSIEVTPTIGRSTATNIQGYRRDLLGQQRMAEKERQDLVDEEDPKNMPTETRARNANKRANEQTYLDENKEKKKRGQQGNTYDSEQSDRESDSEGGSGSDSEHGPEFHIRRPEVSPRHRKYIVKNGKSADLDEEFSGEEYSDDDGDDRKGKLTIDDLKPRPKRMPKTPSEVYDRDLRLVNLDDRARVRKITRELIFPRQKFISPVDRTEVYDHPKQITHRTVQYRLLKELSWTGAYTNQVEMAIRWNTYSKEVEKTLRQQQSTSISQVKKTFLDEYRLYDNEETKALCKIPDLIEYCTKTKPDDFYKIITGSSTAAKATQKIVVYQQFVNCCVQHVVGKIKMSRMGKNLSEHDRVKYEKTITITDEAFALLILEDRWALWNQIYEKRKANHYQLLLGDEDDQRGENDKKEKTGYNLTVYSYHGTLAPNYKGFDAYAATFRINELYAKIAAFREKQEGKRVLKNIWEYCGDKVNRGPKSKKEKKDRSTVPMNKRQQIVTEFSDDGEDDDMFDEDDVGQREEV